MNAVQSLLLGLLQGAAEFLPVSSSGHLLLLRHLLDLDGIPMLYDVLLHVSTLLVVIVVFRSRIASLLGSLWRWLSGKQGDEDRENLHLVLYLLLATAVTAVLGLILSRLEQILLARPRIISLLFLATALLLIATSLARGQRDYLNLGIGAALLIGAAQGIGVLPGISRAGITIAAALFCGLERRRSGELSFLLAVPAVFGALLLELRQGGALLELVSPPALIAGFLASFLVGLLSLLLLLRLIQRGRLALFALYLIPLSGASYFLVFG